MSWLTSHHNSNQLSFYFVSFLIVSSLYLLLYNQITLKFEFIFDISHSKEKLKYHDANHSDVAWERQEQGQTVLLIENGSDG